MGAGSTAWQLTNYDQGGITGYATKSSVNLGEGVPLRIANQAAIGKRGSQRLPHGLVRRHRRPARLPEQKSHDQQRPQLRIARRNDRLLVLRELGKQPDRARQLAAGVGHIPSADQGPGQQPGQPDHLHRPQRRPPLRPPLQTADRHLPGLQLASTATRSTASTRPASRRSPAPRRAVKVSFERPYVNDYNDANWFLKADFPLVAWMERQGYDVDYTESVSVDSNPGQLLNHKTLVISGHDEYWSEAEMNGYKAARNAGVNIASFSGNTAYWKIRYEDGGRTLVCYKAVEGTKEGSVPDGSKGVNDWGPDGVKGTKDDALGLDGKAGTGRRQPQIRDHHLARRRGASRQPQRAGGRPRRPQRTGELAAGLDVRRRQRQLRLPADDSRHQRRRRIRRRPDLAQHRHLADREAPSINSKLNGWEWDSIPTQAQYLSKQPSGVKRVSLTDVGSPPARPSGSRTRGCCTRPRPRPASRPRSPRSSTQPPSGALVFAAGTIQWSWGLAPHYLDKPSESYEDPPVDLSDPRIQQATYNIFADGGVEPLTPVGVVIDGNEPPEASFTATPNPTSAGSLVTLQRLRLDRFGRHDRQIRMGPRRQRQLRDQHGLDPDRVENVRERRRSDGRPADHRQRRRRRSGGSHAGRQQRHARQHRAQSRLHHLPQPGLAGSAGHLQRLGLLGPRRHDRQIRMGPRRQRHATRPTPARPRPPAAPTPAKATARSACESPITAAASPPSPTRWSSAKAAPTAPKSSRPRACTTTGASARNRAAPSPTPSAPARRPPRAASRSAPPERSKATSTRPRPSTARPAPRAPRRRPLRHLAADGRILAQLGGLRQRRRPRARVHPQLQQHQRRLPGRPQRG